MDLLSGSGRRKRGRSPADDCEECMPISKRIHNLNIRSRGCSTEEDAGNDSDGYVNNNLQQGSNCQCTNSCHPQPGASHTPPLGWQTPGCGLRTNGHSVLHDPGGNLSVCQNSSSSCPPDLHQDHAVEGLLGQQAHIPGPPYSPELNCAANPYYYQSNKLLYSAHLLRSRRHQPDS